MLTEFYWETPLGKRSLERLRRKCNYNIKMDIRK
jgi:hypothetical protein